MSKKIIIGLTIAIAIGIGTYAFGHMGGGYGNYDRMHGGPRMHQGYYGEPSYDYRADLKDEDIKALDEERSAFFKETENIRRNLYSKRLELRSELIKNNPDASKAGALQKEISELEAQLDRKRIDHMIKIRKISPDDGRGYAATGPTMGYGSQDPGSCWQ
ncbi:MAG: periplasmic heavy metal sensor [Deltaproteobacteria bacterium]|nr:periplasmic heavy metal sensor [Deltaproteobacteria bacterium]